MKKIEVVVVGGRQCGKSALLEKIHQHLKDEGISVSFVDERAAASERQLSIESGLDILKKGMVDVVLSERYDEFAHIRDHANLLPGREYWLRSKSNKCIMLGKCGMYDGWKFIIARNGDTFGERIWAEKHNDEAFKLFEIIGPIPQHNIPNFDDYVIVPFTETT